MVELEQADRPNDHSRIIFAKACMDANFGAALVADFWGTLKNNDLTIDSQSADFIKLSSVVKYIRTTALPDLFRTGMAGIQDKKEQQLVKPTDSMTGDQSNLLNFDISSLIGHLVSNTIARIAQDAIELAIRKALNERLGEGHAGNEPIASEIKSEAEDPLFNQMQADSGSAVGIVTDERARNSEKTTIPNEHGHHVKAQSRSTKKRGKMVKSFGEAQTKQTKTKRTNLLKSSRQSR